MYIFETYWYSWLPAVPQKFHCAHLERTRTPGRLQGDRDVALVAVSSDGRAFQYVSEALRADKEVTRAFFRIASSFFRDLHDSVQEHLRFFQSFCTHEDFCDIRATSVKIHRTAQI